MAKIEMGIASLRDAYFKNRYILQYYKPWHGYDFKLHEDKYFYDEREWRYVPTAKGAFEAIFDDNEVFQQRKEEYYSALEEPLLVFEPKDINYIVLRTEADRYEVAREIRDIKGKFSVHDVETLVTKILTVEQIQNDI